MKIIGITGGIGSGKSTVSKVLDLMGFPVYNSDMRGRWLSENNKDVITKISALFGSEIYHNNQLDRAKVSELVFKNPSLLQSLNQIIHPAVAQDFTQFIAKNNQHILIFKESAILFESGIYKSLDGNVLVDAPIELRVKRTIKRDGLSEKQVNARMANQWSSEKSIPLADFVIQCDDKLFLLPQIIRCIDFFRRK